MSRCSGGGLADSDSLLLPDPEPQVLEWRLSRFPEAQAQRDPRRARVRWGQARVRALAARRSLGRKPARRDLDFSDCRLNVSISGWLVRYRMWFRR